MCMSAHSTHVLPLLVPPTPLHQSDTPALQVPGLGEVWGLQGSSGTTGAWEPWGRGAVMGLGSHSGAAGCPPMLPAGAGHGVQGAR